MNRMERLRALTGEAIDQCYHCHKCRAGCPVVSSMDYGPDRILRLIQFGRWEQVLTSRDIWLCLGCEMCGAHCPNGIDVGEVMIGRRKLAAEEGYRIASLSYKEGFAKQLDVIDAGHNLTAAGINHARAQHDYETAKAALALACGLLAIE